MDNKDIELLISAIATALLITVAAIVMPEAAESKITEKVKQVCKKDYERLCKPYKIESVQARTCMRSKHKRISARCITELKKAGEVDANRHTIHKQLGR